MNPTVPMLDLTREHVQIASELQQEWASVLARMHLLKGSQTESFEKEIAAYLGVPHACGVASGTDALLLGMGALGIGPGDRVVLAANAFVAALEAVHCLGATPVLVDTEEDGFGPDVESIAAAFPARAVLVVHLYGHPLDLDPIGRLCARGGADLVEDASHAHGAVRGGRCAGTFGAVGCFSAGVIKNLGAYGDAGFVATRDPDLASRVRVLTVHGQERKNHHVRYGYNSRLDELQAAVLRIKLRRLDARNARRRAIAGHYDGCFGALPLRLPGASGAGCAEAVSVYHQYVIRASGRDALRRHLESRGIETGIHYPVPLHRQPAWLRTYGEHPALPRSERLAGEILSLPVFPDLTDTEVERVADAVRSFFD